MPKLNVLVFPYGTEISYEILRSLKNHKLFQTVPASSDPALAEFEPGIHIVPYVIHSQFSREILKLVDRENIDVVVPAHDDVALIFSEMNWPSNVRVVGHSSYVNKIVRNKDRAYQYFEGKLDLPKVFHLDEQLDLPIFIKPKIGQGSRCAHKVMTPLELEYYSEKYSLSDFVISEYLPGTEYTVDCFSVRGNLRYSGARERQSVINGIASVSCFVKDEHMYLKLKGMAKIISDSLGMDGLWFFQAKLNSDGDPALLEIGARTSGTVMLNRFAGVNLVEIAVFYAIGENVSIPKPDFDVVLRRTLVPKCKVYTGYKKLYVDFDDTLLLNESTINAELMAVVFKAKNRGISVSIITKNQKRNLAKVLNFFGVSSVFDEIIHLPPDGDKSLYASEGALFIDDSFSERESVVSKGAVAIGLDMLDSVG